MNSNRTNKRKKIVKSFNRSAIVSLVIELIICLFILGMCFNRNSKSEKVSSNNAGQEASALITKSEEEKEPEAKEEPDEAIDYAALYIEKYNESCRTQPLQELERFIPHDHTNEEGDINYHYRSEFRLNRYIDALGIDCSIGDNLGTSTTTFKSMDIIYWPDKPHYRVYILDNSGEFATAFVDVIKLLHPSAFSDEFLTNLEEAIHNNEGISAINRMIEDENSDMYGMVIIDNQSEGIVEGNITIEE